MMSMKAFLAKILSLILFLLGLPLLGVWLTGVPLTPYLQFPPETLYVAHAGFAWPAFWLLVLFIYLVSWPFALSFILTRVPPADRISPAASFPWWGWPGLTLTFTAWFFAWTRFPWFADLQPYTFFPLWLGYIVVINALTRSRSGTCLMTRNPALFFVLFPTSSLFWWFFEYLNRFVQNWYYQGIESFTPAGYIAHATLCFSTVLPAVAGTDEYLFTCRRLDRALANIFPIKTAGSKVLGWLTLWLAGFGLAGIGVWPEYLFPLLWLAPLLIILAMQSITGEKTILATIRHGDWRPIWRSALAALICGFFWEMWNYKSLAQWRYTVPLVQRFHLFEMPLLGYAGYLPFGMECMVIVRLLRQAMRRP